MSRNYDIDKYLSQATFLNKNYETCWFTELQQFDLGLVFQKRYNLLNWQQGSGKTAATYIKGKYLLDNGWVKNVLVLAPAIATNLTWINFLVTNNEPYYLLRDFCDIEKIPYGVFVVIPTSMQGKLRRLIKKFMKSRSNKIYLIFDESDEITNPDSQRTHYTLDNFRRAFQATLATGTTTRNNINELYSQIELMYNNSVNMICNCETVYREIKDDKNEKIISSSDNERLGLPFPPYRGHILFRNCFCPGKASVLGIEKYNQDIFNKDHLAELIRKTILTRKFREFAGEKYAIKNFTVSPSLGEREVYRIIADEFFKYLSTLF